MGSPPKKSREEKKSGEEENNEVLLVLDSESPKKDRRGKPLQAILQAKGTAEDAFLNGVEPHHNWSDNEWAIMQLSTNGVVSSDIICYLYFEKLRKRLPKTAIVFDPQQVETFDRPGVDFKKQLQKRLDARNIESIDLVKHMGFVVYVCSHYFGIIFDLEERKAGFFDDVKPEPHKLTKRIQEYQKVLEFVGNVTEIREFSLFSYQHTLQQKEGSNVCLLSVLRFLTCVLLDKPDYLHQPMGETHLRKYIYDHVMYEAMYPELPSNIDFFTTSVISGIYINSIITLHMGGNLIFFCLCVSCRTTNR